MSNWYTSVIFFNDSSSFIADNSNISLRLMSSSFSGELFMSGWSADSSDSEIGVIAEDECIALLFKGDNGNEKSNINSCFLLVMSQSRCLLSRASSEILSEWKQKGPKAGKEDV